MRRSLILAAAGALLASAPAMAQIASLTWRTIDGGGETSTGGGYTLSGTIGQADAGTLSGFGYEMLGGFWGGIGGSAQCYPNCDGSTTVPVLTVLDFSCFLNRFFAGDPYANCDGSTTAPVLNVQDFGCFLNSFATGCS
jgi:hypothetical protein